MKKMLSMLLVTLLALTLLATVVLAEAQTYTNETDGYSVSYPEDWTLMSKETIADVTKLASSGGIPGLDATMVSQYLAQVEQLDMMMVMSKDGLFNYNIAYQAMPIELTNTMLIDMVCPATVQQLQAMAADFVVTDAGSEKTVGANAFVHLSGTYSLQEIPLVTEQYYFVAGTKLYIITFTETKMDAAADNSTLIEDVLTSFVPGTK